MTTLITQPQLLASAATDASAIGSALNEAKAAAAGPTSSVVAAAEDEVSAITAQLFGSYGQQYQGLLQRAAAFHDEFVATLAAAGNAYSQAEAEAAGTLGPTGGSAAGPAVGAATQADPAVKAILIMRGAGTATPDSTYMNAIASRYLTNFTGPLVPVTQSNGLYPATGVKELTVDTSLARGQIALNNAINQTIQPGTNQSIAVSGVSESALTSSLLMPKLLAEGFTPNQISFEFTGNEANPNGGVLARFPGFSAPSAGIDAFGLATPSNDFPTTMWTLEYDGFADFPQYPIDFLADLNAVFGIQFVHGTYATLTPTQLASAVTLSQSGAPSMTTYMMIPTQNLPLLDPVRAIPVLGTPIADLLQPDLRYLVNWGYGNPNFGWSTGPADVPTPFGFLPPLSDTTALGPLLISGTQQGTTAFVGDLSHLGTTSASATSLSSLKGLLSGASSGGAAPTMPAQPSIPSTIPGIISGIQSANTNIAGTLARDVSAAYATLLPTADIAVVLGVSLPTYDVNLFLGGIGQALNGNPMGLVNAFGLPLAADVGIGTLAGGFEVDVILNALSTISTGAPHPGLQ